MKSPLARQGKILLGRLMSDGERLRFRIWWTNKTIQANNINIVGIQYTSIAISFHSFCYHMTFKTFVLLRLIKEIASHFCVK